MKKILLSVLILLAVVVPLGSDTHANPFMKQSPDQSASVNPLKAENPFLHKINMLQKHYKEKIVMLGKKIKATNSLDFWMILLGVSFLYGILHAVGPGHGKVIAASYFLNSPSKIIHPVIYGGNFAALHSFSAIILTIIIHFFLKLPLLSSFANTTDIALILSYLIMLCVGVWLLIKSFQKKIIAEQKHSMANLLFVSSISGLVPCPGALIILAFSISIESMLMGILSIFSMAIGMMITVSLTGIIVIISKNTFLATFSANKPGYRIAQNTFSFAGAAFIIILSSTLLLGALLNEY